MKTFRRRIEIKGVPVSDVPIIDKRFLATGYQIRLAIHHNEIFCTDPLFDGKAIPLHYQIKFWKFSQCRIIWGNRHNILALKETLPSRYRNDFGWCPTLVKTPEKKNARGPSFCLAYADNKPRALGAYCGLGGQLGSSYTSGYLANECVGLSAGGLHFDKLSFNSLTLLPDKPKPDPCTDNADNSCPQVTLIERVARGFLTILLFSVCMWLLYGVGAKASLTGWQSIGIILLFFICFLIPIELSDATFYGCGGWSRIPRDFLCMYTQHKCK